MATATVVSTASLFLGSCSLSPAGTATESAPLVVATTPLLADITSHIAGSDAQVISIVPAGSDPHTYEPKLSALRDITRASVVIEQGLLFEDNSIRKMLDANTSPEAKRLTLGEEAVIYGGYHIPLVEDKALDTTWLGLRVGGQHSQDAPIEFRVTAVSGPGNIAAFTTGTFGQPAQWLDSSDGIGGPVGHTNAGGATSADAVALPAGAHTHMSWSFSAAGQYSVELEAVQLNNDDVLPVGKSTIRFAVGVEPGEEALPNGHADIYADQESKRILLKGEHAGVSYEKTPEEAVIAVPHTAQTVVPHDPQWRFLGKAGEPTWILAQAVIGKHVHGEIDPHMWLDPRNVHAYVDAITHTLVTQNPDSAQEYEKRAAAYKEKLEAFTRWSSSVLATIPERSRRLVTTHDAYGYLAKKYGLTVTGFVSANPSLEPSAGELATLTATLRDLHIPAVFIENAQRSGAGELNSIAESLGITVCSLTSDTLTQELPTYIDAMVANVKALKTCLDPESLPPWDFHFEPVTEKP